jgi:hypothetical protein
MEVKFNFNNGRFNNQLMKIWKGLLEFFAKKSFDKRASEEK